MTPSDLHEVYTALLARLLPVLDVDDAVVALVARDSASAWWSDDHEQ